MNLQWTSGINVSAFHTAWCWAHYPDRVRQLSDELRSAADELNQFVVGLPGTTASRFWDQLLTLSANVENSAQLADRLCNRLGLTAAVFQPKLAASLYRCRSQFEKAYPKYAAEMLLRTGPLRQLWDGCGAGLLRMIGQLIGEQMLVEEAQVVLVQPIMAGMGYAHLSTNRIHLEALLTHATPLLPEALRIAWLLSQLDLDRPVTSEQINSLRLRTVVGLGMLSVVLTAGEELELCHYTPELVNQAIEHWYIDTFHLDTSTASAVVTNWWETFQDSRPTWRTALTGLDQLLSQV